jgi:membrane associated rhomboid family serine protease
VGLFNGRHFGEAIVEAPTDIQTYLEQGRQHLAQGQAREAAIAYAHGAQLEPDNPQVHLGLAEANLALGNYSVVQMACQRVQELQPYGGEESLLAYALLDVLEGRYESGLQHVDMLISQNPGIAYTHALRSYLLRTLGQDYDANIARTRAARLSFGGRFDNCFPPRPGGYAVGYTGIPTQASQSADQAQNSTSSWSNRSNLERQIVRTRFALSQYPGLITYSIIAINVIVYLIVGIGDGNLIDLSAKTVFLTGGQNSPWIYATGEYWRIFTAMFLHFSLIHLGLNMLSLFMIGRVVEIIYGRWRYLVIYLGAGAIGGVATHFYYFSDLKIVSAGASGAIFGVFGALGVFYLMNRGSRAYGQGAIGNWLFWLAINLVWGLSVSGIGIVDHIGGLVAGMLLSFLLIPRARRRGI